MNKLDKIYLIVKSWGRGPSDTDSASGWAGAAARPNYQTGDNKIQLITSAKFVIANFAGYHLVLNRKCASMAPHEPSVATPRRHNAVTSTVHQFCVHRILINKL